MTFTVNWALKNNYLAIYLWWWWSNYLTNTTVPGTGEHGETIVILVVSVVCGHVVYTQTEMDIQSTIGSHPHLHPSLRSKNYLRFCGPSCLLSWCRVTLVSGFFLPPSLSRAVLINVRSFTGGWGGDREARRWSNQRQIVDMGGLIEGHGGGLINVR